MEKKKLNAMGFFRINFIAGIAVLLPLWAVYLVIKIIVSFLNQTFLDPILNVLRPYVEWADPMYVIIGIKILLLLIILSCIAALGMLVKNFFVSKLLRFMENVVMRVPFVNKVYVAMQQISSAFLMSKRSIFSRVVLLEYPRKGIYSIGLVTNEAEGEVQVKTKQPMIGVFIPTTPNPTSGFLLMVPKGELIDLEMSVEDSLKLIISGGTVVPPYPVKK